MHSGFHRKINQTKINSLIYCALFSSQATSQNKLTLNAQLCRIWSWTLTPQSTVVIKRTAVSTRMWTGYAVVQQKPQSPTQDDRSGLSGAGNEASTAASSVPLTCQSVSSSDIRLKWRYSSPSFLSSLPERTQGGLVGTSIKTQQMAWPRDVSHYHYHCHDPRSAENNPQTTIMV